jgi:hypothetical protein
MDVDGALATVEESPEAATPIRIFIPGVHSLGKDEVLEPDDSVYIMRHSMNVKWPCLSFDVLRDHLGDQRQRYPATIYLVAGTQADVAKNDEVVVYKLTSLHRTQKSGEQAAFLILFSPDNLLRGSSQATRTRTMMKTTMTTTSTRILLWNSVPFHISVE